MSIFLLLPLLLSKAFSQLDKFQTRATNKIFLPYEQLKIEDFENWRKKLIPRIKYLRPGNFCVSILSCISSRFPGNLISRLEYISPLIYVYIALLSPFSRPLAPRQTAPPSFRGCARKLNEEVIPCKYLGISDSSTNLRANNSFPLPRSGYRA